MVGNAEQHVASLGTHAFDRAPLSALMDSGDDPDLTAYPMMVRIAAFTLTFLLAGGALAAAEVITINFHAIEELAGGEAAGKVAAALTPAADPLTDKTMYAPIDPARAVAAKADPSRSLQILYGRGDLIISPSAKDILVEWI